MKMASFPWFALHPDISTHDFHQTRRDGQPQAGPPMLSRGRTIRLRKWIKNQFALFCRNSNPGIRDSEPHQALFSILRYHRHLQRNFPFVREFDGVARSEEHTSELQS